MTWGINFMAIRIWESQILDLTDLHFKSGLDVAFVFSIIKNGTRYAA